MFISILHPDGRRSRGAGHGLLTVVVPLVFGKVRPHIVVKPLHRSHVGQVLHWAFQSTVVFLREGPERRPVLRAAEHPLELKDQHNLGAAGLDESHECLNTGAVEGAARIRGVGEQTAQKISLAGVLLEVLPAQLFLARSRIEAPSDLVGGGDTGVDGHQNRPHAGLGTGE